MEEQKQSRVGPLKLLCKRNKAKKSQKIINRSPKNKQSISSKHSAKEVLKLARHNKTISGDVLRVLFLTASIQIFAQCAGLRSQDDGFMP